MGYEEYDIRLHCGAQDGELRNNIAKRTGLGVFTFKVLKKSLDARKKPDVFWQCRVGVSSVEIMTGEQPKVPVLTPEFRKRESRVIVVGSGPAGTFAARYLCMCGFMVTVIERGSRVQERKDAIKAFERGGAFPKSNNYSFGEGGAGTFSDGKLSSRTKGLDAERNFVFDSFIKAGAPEEISYMTHPHLGSDNLFTMTAKIRDDLEALGCTFLFDTLVTDIVLKSGSVAGVETGGGVIDADHVIFACGHSAMETYRMLMSRGVPFGNKNFALGFRAEHEQRMVNLAQWGKPNLPAVKAAEYRLAAQAKDGTGVYSFCMCPGGRVVPAAAYEGTSVVNGMSNYARNGQFANAAIVAGINLERLLGADTKPEASLDWLENLERSFYSLGGGYKAPAMSIRNFLGLKDKSVLPASTYSLGTVQADLRRSLPQPIIAALQEGLTQFCRTLKGFDGGILLGLESKTSAPIQVKRDPETLSCGYPNLYLCGEGGGWSGGIVSSACDGLKVARAIAE